MSMCTLALDWSELEVSSRPSERGISAELGGVCFCEACSYAGA